jgi:glutathione S-transferase
MRVYHREGAGRPIRVVWALREAGLEYELVRISPEEGRGPEHLQRHPLGRVPVLEQAEATTFESAAICLHVADLGGDLIAPPGSPERAEIYQWILFGMTEIEPPMIDYYRFHETIAEVAEEGRVRCQRAIDVVGAALGDREYLVGERFTVADIVIGELVRAGETYAAVTLAPNLREYVERLALRPARRAAEAETGGQ